MNIANRIYQQPRLSLVRSPSCLLRKPLSTVSRRTDRKGPICRRHFRRATERGRKCRVRKIPGALPRRATTACPSRGFALRATIVTSHRPGLPNLVGGGGAGRRHCQPSLWPRPTPINCTNGKSTVRSSQPKMMYRRFRGTYVQPRAGRRRGGGPA